LGTSCPRLCSSRPLAPSWRFTLSMEWATRVTSSTTWLISCRWA